MHTHTPVHADTALIHPVCPMLGFLVVLLNHRVRWISASALVPRSGLIEIEMYVLLICKVYYVDRVVKYMIVFH